jgi:DNA gyrase subunit B/topoisomerase-4 subunit B
MYVGGTGIRGYHHLVWEVVDNSVDEAMNGHASKIEVHLHEDGRSITVKDDGRGIPIEKHPSKGVSTLEVVFTVLHAGGKFSGDSYKASGGLHGVGASVVNFLSSNLDVEVRRSGKVYKQNYTQGTPTGDVEEVGTCRKRDTGTQVTFTPDPDVFGDLEFDANTIRERLEIKTYLNKGLRITFVHGDKEPEVFQHDGGVEEYLEHLVKEAKVPPTHLKPILIEEETDGMRVDISFQWTEDTKEDTRSFVNTIPTKSGGTHENGFRAGLMKAVRNYFDVSGSVPKSLDINADDIREGLKAVVSIFLEGDMEIEGQTKERLNNTEVQPAVTSVVRNFLEQYLLNHSSVAEAITTRIVQAAKARKASRSASTQVRRKKPVSKKLTLPGKLADCSSTQMEECELFIVEGDSAGGNAKQARDRRTQAVLPLRGKILNTESATMKSILKNKEISNIVEALGCGMDDKYNGSRLRYGKIILLMDADSDGHHIATLLLTFFYRYMPELVKAGRLYLAQPPLYKIAVGTDLHWAADDAERDAILKSLSAAKAKRADISRFKGLGEMMKDTLKETTLDRNTRQLLPVEVPDEEEEATDSTIKSLLGRSSKARYDFILDNLSAVDDLDI